MPQHKRLKINYILPDFDENAYSGGLYVIFEHCNGLIKRGHDVRVFNNTGKKSKYLQLDCQVELHKNDPSIVESNAPDIIVGTHWCTYFFVNRMKDIVKNDTKLCFLVQNDDRFIYSEEDRQIICKIMTARYMDIIPIYKIVVSQYLKDVVKDVFGEESFYVKNGFVPKEVTALISKSEKTMIAARYDPSGFRGWDTVDKVLHKISKRRGDIEIHLFEMKDKKPTRYKNIFHKGLAGDSLLGLFKSCDIYLSGSRYEGFSYPLIEAMSQGACICCTDAGGNREFCIDGETALMSPRDDAEALYRNLVRLIDDKNLRHKIREKALRKTKEFLWDESFDSLDEFFISLAEQNYSSDIVNTAKVNEKVVHDKGDVLFIYTKDPFVNYRDWVNVEESVRYLKNSGFNANALLMIDRHASGFVRNRLSMLIPPEWVDAFAYKVFYSKKLKLRLPLLPRLLFKMTVIADLIGSSFTKEKRYARVFLAPGGKSIILKTLCRLLKIKFCGLDLNRDEFAAYRFDSYWKEHAEKEIEYKALVDKALGAVIGQ